MAGRASSIFVDVLTKGMKQFPEKRGLLMKGVMSQVDQETARILTSLPKEWLDIITGSFACLEKEWGNPGPALTAMIHKANHWHQGRSADSVHLPSGPERLCVLNFHSGLSGRTGPAKRHRHQPAP